MIGKLDNIETFRRRRQEAWKRNGSYWLSEPLRHVVDVGEYITNRVLDLVEPVAPRTPTVLDIGCGDCWLLSALQRHPLHINYIGLDNNPEFISSAKAKFTNTDSTRFILADLEEPSLQEIQADVVVNAFNFFELAELRPAMKAALGWCRPEGTLLMSTIDKTYLILALSNSWEDFHANLAKYQNQAGTKYDFQKIDLGTAASETLEYPSVLYSTQDFIDSAKSVGWSFESYVEQAFTAKTIPKIYCHLEFRKPGGVMRGEETK